MEEQKQTSMDLKNQILQPIWIFENALSKNLCELIIEESKDFEMRLGGIGNSSYSMDIRKTYIRWASENHWLQSILQGAAWTANYNSGWNYNLTYSEQVQIGIYEKSCHYDWHYDWMPFTKMPDIRKISLVCLLNDPSEFEGGELELSFNKPNLNETTIAPLKQGTIIAFPSFIPHRVKEVTKGKRITAVSWVHGDRA